MNNSKKGLGIIIVLFIVLIGVLTLGILKEKKMQKDSESVTSEWVASKDNNTSKEDKKEEEKPSDEEKKEDQEAPKEENKGLYSKLKNKSDVRMLVLGDGLALSQGRNTTAGMWDKEIANWMTNTYGSKVELVSLARAGATSGVGYEVATNNDISNYDLIIICFGQNDNNKLTNINTFNANYQGIVNKVKEKNPNGTILPILPSTLVGDNEYRVAMQNISKNNTLNAIDVSNEFANSGVAINQLVGNGGLPNDKGYGLYIKAVTKYIEDSMN